MTGIQPSSAAAPAPADPGYLERHLAAISQAAELIRPYIRRTPTLTTELDPALRLKPECFQVTGSFKPRGAFNAVLRASSTQPPPKGVLAVSSGNHAQAVALAARTAGFPALILIPEDANPAKVAATRALGAEVITQGVTFANREARARELVESRGLTLIHPFDDWDVIHGQGTAALELLADVPSLGTVVAPLGGGGLLSGTALTVKATRPEAAVVGVEPAQADDAYRSFTARRLETLPAPPTTIADGVRTVSIGRRNFEVMVEKRLVDAVVTVTEAEIESAVVTAWTRLKLALEPTGALPLAAYLAAKLPAAAASPGRSDAAPTALILSGGNFDPALVARLLTSS